jgi:hypothetical protein
MSEDGKPAVARSHRDVCLKCEDLEGRRLLSGSNLFRGVGSSYSTGSFFSSSAFVNSVPFATRNSISSSNSYYSQQLGIVSHDLHLFVSHLKAIELGSRATPEEFRALRDDARAISEQAQPTGLSAAAASERAIEVSIQLDRSVLDGSLKDAGWAQVAQTLSSNLRSLGIPQSLIDQTLSDMKAVAASADVSAAENETLTRDIAHLGQQESVLTSPGFGSGRPRFPDPNVYFTQHLRGFFRGWAQQKVADETKLSSDLKTLAAQTASPAASLAVLRRDSGLLEKLGSRLPSSTGHQLDDAFESAFAAGAPTSPVLAQLRVAITTILDGANSAANSGRINRLATDAPAFFQSAGSSPTGVRVVVDDTKTVVDDGGNDALNPFKVQIRARPRGR